MPDGVIEFIEMTKMSIDELNELYSGYKKLNKAGMEVTKEEYRSALDTALSELDGDLSNLDQIIQDHFSQFIRDGENFEEDWNAIISAIGSSFATSALDMGQQIESFGNTINKFYETATKWGEMTESEKMEFKTDNAELFKAGGKKLLAAFESGNYEDIEAAIAPALEERRQKQLEEVRQTLAIERARKGDDRDDVYIAELERYEAYLEDTTDLFKANLELQLEQQEKQLDEYRSLMEKEQEALEESLNKRKEAYENYFDAIDQKEEDKDYEDKVNLIVGNLNKIGATSNASAQKQAQELEQQLKDLESERLQELRERAREAILDNIDDELSNISEKFDKLLESNQALLLAMQGDLEDPKEFLSDLIETKLEDGATQLDMQDYLADLESIYGSVLGDKIDWEVLKEEINQVYMNISGQDVALTAQEQQTIYEAIDEAMRSIGKR